MEFFWVKKENIFLFLHPQELLIVKLYVNSNGYKTFYGGFILAEFDYMLTRREVLLQLKRVGVTEVSQLKLYLRDFEKYMAETHGVFLRRQKTGLVEQRGGASSFLYPEEKSLYFLNIDGSNSDQKMIPVRRNIENKKEINTRGKPGVVDRGKKKIS